MSAIEFFDSPQGRRIAYHRSEGRGPWLVFLGGLKSDMQGTKAVFLEAWAKAQGRAFLRFDYSGHGQSSGRFEAGCIGDWHQDTVAAVSALTAGPIVAVGSSMGGWQAPFGIALAADTLGAGLTMVGSLVGLSVAIHSIGTTDVVTCCIQGG